MTMSSKSKRHMRNYVVIFCFVFLLIGTGGFRAKVNDKPTVFAEQLIIKEVPSMSVDTCMCW